MREFACKNMHSNHELVETFVIQCVKLITTQSIYFNQSYLLLKWIFLPSCAVALALANRHGIDGWFAVFRTHHWNQLQILLYSWCYVGHSIAIAYSIYMERWLYNHQQIHNSTATQFIRDVIIEVLTRITQTYGVDTHPFFRYYQTLTEATRNDELMANCKIEPFNIGHNWIVSGQSYFCASSTWQNPFKLQYGRMYHIISLEGCSFEDTLHVMMTWYL